MKNKKTKQKEVCNGHVTVTRGRGWEGWGVANDHMTVGGQGGRGYRGRGGAGGKRRGRGQGKRRKEGAR